MTAGDRIYVSARGRGRALAKVEAVHTPAELPELTTPQLCAAIAELPELDLADRSAANAVRAILEEWGVDRVAAISYEPEPGAHQRLVFMALHVPAGWYDLQRQKLTIEPAV